MPVRSTAVDLPLETLSAVFGYSEFRSHQREIIEHVIAGGSAFVLMPTGGGKSLCFQVPALLREGTAVVVSPLISLMKDQVDALRANGVAAAYLNSSLSAAESSGVISRAALRGARPALRRARAPDARRLPRRAALGDRRAVRDRRGALRQPVGTRLPTGVRAARTPSASCFPGIPLIALTATADDQTREDVRERLQPH